MIKVNHSTYARALKMLLDDPVTAHEIAEETGLHIVTAQHLMRTLKQHRIVRVVAWEKDRLGRDAIPVYGLGEGRDRPRHKVSPAVRAQRYRDRKALRAQQAATAGVRT